jgi:hypothetical protein
VGKRAQTATRGKRARQGTRDRGEWRALPARQAARDGQGFQAPAAATLKDRQVCWGHAAKWAGRDGWGGRGGRVCTAWGASRAHQARLGLPAGWVCPARQGPPASKDRRAPMDSQVLTLAQGCTDRRARQAKRGRAELKVRKACRARMGCRASRVGRAGTAVRATRGFQASLVHREQTVCLGCRVQTAHQGPRARLVLMALMARAGAT